MNGSDPEQAISPSVVPFPVRCGRLPGRVKSGFLLILALSRRYDAGIGILRCM